MFLSEGENPSNIILAIFSCEVKAVPCVYRLRVIE